MVFDQVDDCLLKTTGSANEILNILLEQWIMFDPLILGFLMFYPLILSEY